MGDTDVQHPDFRSTATMPDGSVEPVTTFAYVKYKIKLYQISSPIIGDLYFHRNSTVTELATKVSRINEELLSFCRNLPPELKLDELCRNPNETVTASTRPFMLQALALQIAYDNVQILLHRPLLSQDLRDYKARSQASGLKHSGYSLGADSAALRTGIVSSPDVHQILISSRDHCWDSAIRSSMLGKYKSCLVSARESHAAAFLGINLFTAGMVLCVVALSRPLSSQAQTAKQAVARIMSLSRFLSGRALLSAQTTKILKDLVRLIGEKEIKAMLSGSEGLENVNHGQQTPLASTNTAPSAEATPGPMEDTRDYSNQSADTQTPLPMQQQADVSNLNQDSSYLDGYDFSGFENMDFNNGINTLQQGMFRESALQGLVS
jgi:hypothetical protein